MKRVREIKTQTSLLNRAPLLLSMCDEAWKLVGLFLNAAVWTASKWERCSKSFKERMWNMWSILYNPHGYQIKWIKSHSKWVVSASFDSMFDNHFDPSLVLPRLRILHLRHQSVPTRIPCSVRVLRYSRLVARGLRRKTVYEPLALGCDHVEQLTCEGGRVPLLPLIRFVNLTRLSISDHKTTKLCDESYDKCYQFEVFRHSCRLVSRECAIIISEFITCNLQELVLRANTSITTLPLAYFRNLTHLDLSSSGNIRNLDGLMGLPLKTVILANCSRLVNIDGLRESWEIQFVDLNDCCQLEDVNALFCPKKEHLKGVWLRNTPIPRQDIVDLRSQNTLVYRDPNRDAYKLAFEHLVDM